MSRMDDWWHVACCSLRLRSLAERTADATAPGNHGSKHRAPDSQVELLAVGAAVFVPRRKASLQALIQRELDDHVHDAQQRGSEAAAAIEWVRVQGGKRPVRRSCG